jgi:DNA polymerase-3 subunit epsilon
LSRNNDFIALDVETANERMTSICQIGLSIVENGETVKQVGVYINPQDYFKNTPIHGIDATMVKNSPTFPEALVELRPYLSGRRVVHHTHFDRVALQQTADFYHVDLPEMYLFDSARIARACIPRYHDKGYGLKDLCKDYRICQERIHDALDDSRVLAQALLAIFAESNASFQSWESPIVTNRVNNNTHQGEGLLHGVEISIARKLKRSIEELSQLISDNAGTYVETPTSNTTFVLLPKNRSVDKVSVDPNKKEKSTLELINTSAQTTFLNENNFYDYVDRTSLCYEIYIPIDAKPAIEGHVEPTISEKKAGIQKNNEGVSDGPLSGHSIVFTGDFSQPRERLEEAAKRVGLNVRSGVSRTTNYLVVGDTAVPKLVFFQPSKKRETAEMLNTQGAIIQILSEREFISLLEALTFI